MLDLYSTNVNNNLKKQEFWTFHNKHYDKSIISKIKDLFFFHIQIFLNMEW